MEDRRPKPETGVKQERNKSGLIDGQKDERPND
jgi:hypothetical protein